MGRKIKNRYMIEKLIARGSLSSVYVVSDLEVPGREYILKEIVDTEHDAEELKVIEFRFIKQVEELKRISFDGIARIYDGFVESGRFYVLMEYIPGMSFDKILVEEKQSKPLSEQEAIAYFYQIASIMTYLNSEAHFRRVFREIKPSNFVLSLIGRVYLVDFGIAPIFFSPEKLREVGRGFISPEVIAGNEPDARSDVYSIGALIYFLVTGTADGLLLHKIPDAKKLNPKLSEEFSDLLKSCLLEKEKRIENPALLKKRISKLLKEKETADLKFESAERNERQNTGLQRKILLATIFVLILVVSFPFLSYVGQSISLYLCKKNCEKIGTALSKYASDHGGRYPEKLASLIPEYMKNMPKCLSGGKDTYSSSYKSYNLPGLKYYRFYCAGDHHSQLKIPDNFPRYDSVEGLIERPDSEIPFSPVETLAEAYSLDSRGNYPAALRKFRDLAGLSEDILTTKYGIEKYIVFWNMARVLEKMNKKDEALEKYQSAGKFLIMQNLQVFNPEIVFSLMMDLRRFGNKRYALNFYNILTQKYVLEREKPDIQTISDMADIYLKIGEINSAVKLWKEFYNKAPTNEKAFVSAEVYRLKGNKDRAKSYYKQYVDQTGQKTMYERATKWLNEL